MVEEVKKPTEEPKEEPKKQLSILEEAAIIRDEILKAKEELKKEKEELLKLKMENLLGSSAGGQIVPEIKKYTDIEIAEQVEKGELDPLRADGFI